MLLVTLSSFSISPLVHVEQIPKLLSKLNNKYIFNHAKAENETKKKKNNAHPTQLMIMNKRIRNNYKTN